MTKKIFVSLLMLTAGVFFIPLLHAQDPKVMPPQYAGVAAGMTYDETITYGYNDSHLWNKIVLWGRTTNNKHIDNSYSYSWDYGDGSAAQAWTAINSYSSSSRFSPSSEYLCSDQHAYPAISTDIKYFTATLRISNNANIIISSTTLQVTKMNYSYIDKAHGYSASDIPIVKRTFVESITKGRGLTNLYLLQDRSGGNADGSLPGQVNSSPNAFNHYTGYVPVYGTALAMQDFLLNGHSIDDPTGSVDPYYDCVMRGMNYIFRNGKILPAASIFGSSSDMNGNGTMVKFTGTPYIAPGTWVPGAGTTATVYTEMVQHGVSMQALGLFRNGADPSYTVNIGPSPGTPMLLSDVVKDAVDLAINAQHAPSNINDFNQGWGWRRDETFQGVRDCDSSYYNPATGNCNCFGTSLNETGAIVRGLESIEQNWKIKTPSFVRERLVHLVKSMQSQWNVPCPNNGDPTEAGSGNSTVASHYSDGAYTDPHWTSPPPYGVVYGMYENTADLLAVMHYLSMDTSETSVCGCDPGNPSSLCNSKSTDFKLIYNPSTGDYSGSCKKVMAAINWFGSHNNDIFHIPIYAPYTMAQLLRSYNYVKGGVNDGMLDYDYQLLSLPKIQGTSYSWEDGASSHVTGLSSVDGQWWDYNIGSSDIVCSWALNVISPSGNSAAQTIKTENECPHTILQARVFRPFDREWLY